MIKIKILLSIVLYRLGIFSIIRFFNRKRLTIITYHSPAPDILERHFTYLSKIYKFITIDKYYESIKNKEKLHRYCLLVTFDDGYKSNVDLLPVFKKYACIPVIYLCSSVAGTKHPFWDKIVDKKDIPFYKNISNKERLQILEKKKIYTLNMVLQEPQALTHEDIMKLQEQVIFGSHTRTHTILPRCTNTEQENEIIESREELEKFCGKPIVHFSYPNGDYNQYSIECVKKAGYITARTIRHGWNDIQTDMFQLKQAMISDDADENIMRLQLSGITTLKNIIFKKNVKRNHNKDKNN
jgi:peptidoglycan/xylan/chitin deacetylase (PgdA/CDA1 family)